MDRHLIAGALLLLSLEVSWLLNDLKIIHVPLFNQSEIHAHSVPIGKVLSTKQDLRRRPMDSILWEESRANDTLFFYDTILTLDQSAATIQMNDDSELTLAENTLVVLEPANNESRDQLRVKFTRGQLHSRNLAAATEIIAPKWTMQVEKGAEIKLRSVGNEQMEIELLKGKLELQGEHETLNFDDGQVILLHNEQAQAIPISAKLAWASGRDNIYRVYSHSFPAMTWLRWTGPAKKLRLTKPGRDQAVYPLPAGQEQYPLRLEPGLYQARLENDTDTSPTLAVQVWKAPAFHLLSPLPRNRFNTGTEVLFTWTTAGLISKYRFELGRDENLQDIVQTRLSESSNITMEMPEKGQYYWRVQALDDLDFPIPSLDTHLIFSVKDPFKAPKLHTPEVRKPAKDDTSFNWKKLLDDFVQLLLPRAEAKPVAFEAVFSWDEIEGAEHYYIEIDVDPNFPKPVVVQKTRLPQFVWNKASVGVFYWRVAAGAEDRMGLFSEAAKVKLQTPTATAKEVAPGVQVRKIKSEPVPEMPVVAALEKPEPTPIPTPEPPVPYRPAHFSVTYGMGFDYSILTGDQSASAFFSGIAPLRLGLNMDLPVGREASMWTDVVYSRSLWKPKSTNETPFQPQLTDTNLRAHIHYRGRDGVIQYGIYATNTSKLKRTALETVGLEPAWLFGPAFGFNWLEFEKIGFTHLFSLAGGQGMTEVATTHRGIRRVLLNEKATLLLGGDLNLTFQRHNDGSNFRIQFGVNAGIEW